MEPILLLTRLATDDQGTDGKLFLTSLPNCDLIFLTLELPYRNNLPNVSAINPGDYQVAWLESTPKHPDGVYMLQNVEGHDSIEMHIGNYGGDESLGWASDIDGCIIMGLELGTLMPDPDKYQYIQQPAREQKAVLESTEAYNQFVAALNKKPFTLKIIEQFEAPSSNAS